MVAYLFALFLYILTIAAIVAVAKKSQKHFSILSFPYYMRCMTVLISIPFNLTISVYVFVALFSQVYAPGYLRVFYHSCISWLVYMMMLLLERFIVKQMVVSLWKQDLGKDMMGNIKKYEERLAEYPKDSEYYSETVYALSYLYKSFIARAKARGEESLVKEFEKRFWDLADTVGLEKG